VTVARKSAGLCARSWDDSAEVRESIQRGDFEIKTDEKTGQRWFWFRCPGECGQVSPIALRPVVAKGIDQSWEFDGNEGTPTLNPSINHVGCWHGWLRAGLFSLA
jgi:hypothetical protein